MKELALFLTSTKLGPLNRQVKKLSREITGNRKTLLQKAKAIYNWTTSNMYRDPKTRGCGTGNVCALLNTRGGKCTDISSVFVTLARASGIPAREIFGIRLGKQAEEDITTWYHCWAEFFLPGLGWVPVDPADVRKLMLVKNIRFGSPDYKKYYKYYWGGIDQHRVKLSMGRDLFLNPQKKGFPVNYLMYPFAQVGGVTIDWLNPADFQYKINFKKE